MGETMTDKELMQQALASLKGYARNCRCEGGGGLCDAGKALKARLAQPDATIDGMPAFEGPLSKSQRLAQSEPYVAQAAMVLSQTQGRMSIDPVTGDVGIGTVKLQREWQGLTDEEVNEAAHKCVKSGQSVNAAIRAIEAKLKEKNAI